MGRRGIYASGNEVEWATPVLFQQVADGRIFNIRWKDASRPKPEIHEMLTSLYEALPAGSREPPDPSRFRVDRDQVSQDTVVVSVHGDIDLFTAPVLKQELTDVLEAGGRGLCLVVDLSGVTFLDSTCLGVLTGMLKRLRSRRGELRLVVREDDEPTRKTFAITGLDLVFAVYPSREAALGLSRPQPV
jgi:anti-sigma B factor antagonist